MAKFRITTPDGAVYVADAPDEQSAINAIGHLYRGNLPEAPAAPKAAGADPWEGFKLIERAPAANADWSGFKLIEAAPQDGEAPPLTIKKGPSPPVATDALKSFGGGMVRGAMALPGIPRALQDMGDALSTFALKNTVGRAAQAWRTGGESFAYDPSYDQPPVSEGRLRMKGPTPADTIAAGEALFGETYRPQTEAGRFAAAAGEVLPAMAGGPGSVAQKLTMAAGAGVGGEFGGYAGGNAFGKGSTGESVSRFIGGALGGLAAGAPFAIANRPNAVLSREMGNVSQATMDKASQLMADARRMGVNLTWPEAIQRTTGGATDLANLQRVVESTGGGASVLRPFMADRTAALEAAGRKSLDNLAPVAMTAQEAGPAVQKAAAGSIEGVRGAINDATRPLYKLAETDKIAAADFARIQRIPAFQKILSDLRSHPLVGPTLEGFADDTVKVIDAVKKRFDDMASEAGRAGRNHESALAGGLARDVKDAATAASPIYDTALQAQAHARQRFLDPMEAGLIGRAAETGDIAAQARLAFPRSPMPNSSADVGEFIGHLARRDRRAAETLVRSHAENVFDEAMRTKGGMVNQWGGATFAERLIGNPQQAAGLEAAVRALPNGGARWEGFKRFLSVAEATGARQKPGSATAANMRAMDELQGSGVVRAVGEAVTSGGTTLPFRLRDWFDRARLAGASADMARILTDPKAEGLLRQLAREKIGSGKAQAIAFRLTALATAGEAPPSPVAPAPRLPAR